MTPKHEEALYNLLYNLEAVHHLQEARFYCTCLVDSKAVPAHILEDCIERLGGMMRYVGGEYMLLVKHTDLDLPPSLGTCDEQLVKKILRRVKAALREAE